ncbi:MAG: ATP-dependent Clp protease proteolytic subunit [bacterium]|nr:ATP-dependent Clp protease proteolytic subunit [bacterium]
MPGSTRPWSKTPTGPIVGPFVLLNRDNRVLTLFGTILASTDVGIITSDSMPFLAENVTASLLILGSESKDPITLLVNNGGGSVQAGITIIQAIEHLKALEIPVRMVVMGTAASMASVILATGSVGHRYAFPRALIHFHSGRVGQEGTPEEVERHQEFVKRLHGQLQEILAFQTKLPEYFLKEVRKEWEKDSAKKLNPGTENGRELRLKFVKEFLNTETYLSAKQALEAGVIDKILEPGDPLVNEIFHIQAST